MNIFIINHAVENCGVYQYGKRFAEILSKSKTNFYFYFELHSIIELEANIKLYHPKIIIYNYLSGTMPWLNEEIVQKLRETGIIQLLIVHNKGYAQFFDYYLHQDPNYVENKNNFRLLRPIPIFEHHSNTVEKKDIIKIGSFGFGFRVKHFDEICKMVNNQFDKSIVIIRLHLTLSHFCPNSVDLASIIQQCQKNITKENIELQITTHFMSDIDLLKFLHENDLNIFFYEKYDCYNGISSSIDFALAAKRPIAICKSNMFSHIYNTTPSICVEDLSLPQIMENGTKPLEHFYDLWSNENFVYHMDRIISSVSLSTIGFFYTCFKEKKAVEYSVSQTMKWYPNSPIYLVSDGGLDFSYLKNEISTLDPHLEEDTMSGTFRITDRNFTEEEHQITIKRCAMATLQRLKQYIDTYSHLKYIVMMDPDALIRGELHIPYGVKLLGSRINCGFPQGFKDVFSKVSGAIVINHWGATPAIFEVDTFKRAYIFIMEHMTIFDELCKNFYAVYAHDVLLPSLFALIGYEETFNPDITECNRHPDWQTNGKPLIHQFRKYY